MAGIAYVRKRLWNPELIVDAEKVLPDELKNYIKGRRKISYEIRWTGATQAGEELGTAASSVKDGTTTPFQVTVVSAGATDIDTAAGHVRKVALIGISVASVADYTNGVETPLATVEVVAMNGTTDVLSTRYYLWVDGAYACHWGSGGTDAAAAITIESPANTTLLTIPAGNNEGDGGVWHFPANRHLSTEFIKIEPTATLAAGDGMVLSGTFTSFDQALNADPDIEVDYYTYIKNAGGVRAPSGHMCPVSRFTTVKSKCLWSEALVANSQTIQTRILQILSK